MPVVKMLAKTAVGLLRVLGFATWLVATDSSFLLRPTLGGNSDGFCYPCRVEL